MERAVLPTTVPYFYGRIARDEAEKILHEKGCQEGLFLLRESMSTAGNYALSICHNGRVHHYHVERQQDGNVMIQDGRRFIGPIELVTHHKRHQDGFLTRPTIPCNRPENQSIYAWPGVTMLQLEHYLYEHAKALGLVGVQLEHCFGPQRHLFVAKVAKTLHKEQPWFHSRIDRDRADLIMTEAGHRDGKYLIRERGGNVESYALSLSHRNLTKHYRIDKHNTHSGVKFAIEDGPKFDSLMDMVAHYHNRADGLLCKLTESCARQGFKQKRASDTTNPIYHDGLFMDPATALVNAMGNDDMDEPDIPHDDSRRNVPLPAIPADDDPQKIYDPIPITDAVFNLNKNDLDLKDPLGSGNFGSVMRGVYKWNRKSIPVAVKTLKQDELAAAKEELIKEARLMGNLQHRHIVRMIGVCKAEMIMLVLELAELGPLHKYLKKHKEMSMQNIVELMFQVAEGMAYLEDKNFVHRDLAARNVLLVNEHFAKISDFGMSKALGIDSDYYKANVAGKWPLKWYAPECIYFFRFDSKSDVWSYGVTLWEAASFGEKPYRGMKGNQILELIDHGKRLDKPDRCPAGVYDVMLKCWQYNKEDRPSFREIIELLRKYK